MSCYEYIGTKNSVAYDSELTLHRSPPNGLLCPGEVLTFTCATNGSSILAWISDEYIGTQLGFATFNNIGDTRTSPMNPNTVATLINKTNENGVDMLVSTLRIKVLSDLLDSSVTCMHIDDQIMSTERVQVIGM